MSDQNGTPQVTMSNTKKEMMDAYEAAKQQIKVKEKQLLDAEKARKQIEKELAEATAETQASQDPLHRLYDLRGAISRELTSLSERFETEIDAFRKIQSAIKSKQEELKNIYGVETASSDLAALIEAQRAKKEDFEREMEKRHRQLEDEIKEIRGAWEKEKSEREQQNREQADILKKQRKREQEEFDYAFNREKEQRKNQLEDELTALAKEIEQKRKDFEQESGHIRSQLDVREAAISKSEAEADLLRKEVEAFPQRMEMKVKEAVDTVTERLTSDFQKTRELLEAKFEGEKNVLSSRIESLEKSVKSQEAQLEDLSRRNDQAYEKVQDIANRAVASAKKEYVYIPQDSKGFYPHDDKQGK